MSNITPRRGRVASGFLVAALAFGGSLVGIPGVASTPSVSAAPVGAVQEGGPVIVDGTDSGLHGSISFNPAVTPDASELNSTWVYMLKAWETLLTGVPASYDHNDRVAVVGASFNDTATSNNCGAAVNYISERLAFGSVPIDYFEGPTAIGDLFDDVLTGDVNYQMIQIVEDDKWCGNGMSIAESTIVDSRGPAIAAHVNRGGALFAQSQPYGWLSSLFPDLSPKFSGCSGSSPELTDAGFAQFPGLTNADIAAPWHNCFEATGDFPLAQLALQSDTDTVILGGESVTLPSTVTLTTEPEQPRPGDEVCTTATVVDSSGDPVEGASVEFFVDDVSVGSQLTDASGIAEYCYIAEESGEEEVEATVTTGPGTGSNSTTITTSTLSIDASPTATLDRGDEVCIDVYAASSDGETDTPLDGATINFEVDGPNGPASSSDVTDVLGDAQYCYTGENGGTDTVTATIAGDDSSDSRSILVNWSGAFVNVVDVEQDANGTDKVVPVTIDEFAEGTLYATVSIPVGNGTLSLNTSGFTVSLTAPAASFTDQTTLAFEGSVANITGLLASRLTWDAPTDPGTTAITVTVADDPSDPVQTATDIGSLSVTAPPVLTKQPETQTVDGGTTIMLHAHSTGVPTPVAQWQVSTDDGATWTNVPGGEEGHFMLPVTNEMDGWWYRARVSNSSGNVISDIAVLTVNQTIPATATYTALGDLDEGVAITPATPVVTGDPAPTFSVTDGALPAGLILDVTTGVISGTPTVEGPYSFTVTATNVAGSDDTEFTGNIVGEPTPEPEGEPTVEVEPPSQPDEPVVVRGGGFVPGTTVEVIVDGEVVSTTVADENGDVSVEVPAPSNDDYSVGLRAEGDTDGPASRRVITGFDGKSVAVPQNSGYVPLVPQRVLDTRESGERVGAGETYRLAVESDWNVPASATTVALNVTATRGAGEGYLTVFPCGEEMPLASAVNYVPGTDTPNLSLVAPGENDEICIYSQWDVDLVVDLNGYFAEDVEARLVSQTPVRLVDTRDSDPIGAGETREVQVTGGELALTTSNAAVVNVVAVNAASIGYLTLFPCDQDMPLASNVNYEPGSTNAGQAYIKLSPTGTVCVFSPVEVDVVVDLNASFIPGDAAQLVSNTPTRVLDTRETAPLTAGQTIELALGGADGVEGATAFAVNLTATESQDEGFITAYPCAEGLPLASSVNLAPGRSVANHSTATPDADGNVCIYTSAATHLVVDVEGIYL